ARAANAAFFLSIAGFCAVYGIVRDNGRRLDVTDAVDGRDAAYDLSEGMLGRPVAQTRAMTEVTRREIRRQLGALAGTWRYRADRRR
ncbi:MAG TPA: hypothetical protein VNG89_18080, partial [Vicinamibacterales bacterium]|nr:hypothetical protein [Vicinamibacterales bacterium]